MNPLWRRFTSPRSTKVSDMQATEPNPYGQDADASATHPEIEAILAERDAAQAELARVREEFLREHAELENSRKRQAREVEQSRKFANERLLGDLLTVFDGLEHGLLADTTDAAALREGMDLTLKALTKVGEGNGLKAVDPIGQPFNPELHQAMTMVEAPGKAPNTVVAVMQKGYVLNDRLLRPALVAIAKAPGA